MFDLKMLLSVTDKEHGLAIALTVFVILTVVLVAYIVLLYKLPGFRDFFFRDGGEKSEGKTKPEVKTKPKKEPKPKLTREEKKQARIAKKQPHLAYTDEIMTVPLGDMPEPREEPPKATFIPNTFDKPVSARSKREKTSFDDIPEFVIDTPKAKPSRAQKESAATKPNDKKAKTAPPPAKQTKKK